MWLVNVFIIISFLLPSHECIMVITTDVDERPRPDAHFIIPNLNFSSLETFTMCGRFNIYQFIVANRIVNGKYEYNGSYEMFQGIFPGFRSFSLVACDYDKYDEFCMSVQQLLGSYLKPNHVFEIVSIFGKYESFETFLKPSKWNSFCVRVNNINAVLKINKDVRFFNKKSKKYVKPFHDDIFMNTDDMNSPMYGAFTDINVWDRMLTSDEQDNWMNCLFEKFEQDGNIIGWQNHSQHIQLLGLNRVQYSINNICPKKLSHLFIVNDNKSFIETFDLCNKIGKIKEISSNETASEINKILDTNSFTPCNGLPHLFTGYSDIEAEGDWVLHNTNKKMSWNNWAPYEPNMVGGDLEACVLMNRSNMILWDVPCNMKFENTCPLCHMAEVKVW